MRTPAALRRLLSAATMIAISPALAPAQDATLWMPDGLNAVLAIDVASAYRSPIALQEQWAKKAAESFVAQEVFLPPSAQRVTIGAELNLLDALSPVRQHVVLDLKPGTELEGVAALTGSTVETTSGIRGLSFPNGRYIVEAQPQRWLMAHPGGRQAGLRWARSGPAKASPLSSLLKQAAASASDKSPVVIALDLADAVDQPSATAFLQELPGAPLKGSALQNAAKVLASVRGVVCKVTLGAARMAECRIEFGESADPLGPVALPLVQAVLNRGGASLEDPNAWKARVDGYALVFEGELSASGLKRLISLVRPPVLGTSGGMTGDDQPAATIAASRKYYRSIDQELDDLRKTMKRVGDNHITWYERSARTIDDLPLKNVDKDLQTFGARVSNSLRYQAQAERMSNIQKGTRGFQSGAYTTTGYAGYGGVYAIAGGNQQAISAEQNQATKSVRFGEWKQIEDGLVEIRRALTNKYNEEF